MKSILVAVTLLACCLIAEAQQPRKLPVIGYLGASGDTTNRGLSYEAFRKGLEDLGYTEGKNILIEYRGAEGKLERAPGHVAELLQLNVNVLVVGYLAGTRAAKQATKTTPIVMVSQEDPVEIGLVDSLAHPGGNVTGLSTFGRELSGKRLEMLKEVIPKGLKVALIWDANAPGPPIAANEYQTVAQALKIPLQPLAVQGPKPDLDGAFKLSAKNRANALIVIRNPIMRRNLNTIVDLAMKNRLASMGEGTSYVEAGLIMSYAADEADQFKRAALYVDKILKGRKPADLPVEQPMKLEFVINLKNANRIGLTIPQWTLMKADRVIK
jgi:putative ABC transport system substrate-binding protein